MQHIILARIGIEVGFCRCNMLLAGVMFEVLETGLPVHAG